MASASNCARCSDLKQRWLQSILGLEQLRAENKRLKADFEMVTKCNTKLAAASVAWYSSAKHWKDHHDSDEAMNNLLAEGCRDNQKTLEDMGRKHKETIRRLHKRIDEQLKQK